MPIYEYECPRGHRTERIRRIVEADSMLVCRVQLAQTDYPFYERSLSCNFLMERIVSAPSQHQWPPKQHPDRR